MVERKFEALGVGGSIPLLPTNFQKGSKNKPKVVTTEAGKNMTV